MKTPITHDAQWGIYRDADGAAVSFDQVLAACNAHVQLVAERDELQSKFDATLPDKYTMIQRVEHAEQVRDQLVAALKQAKEFEQHAGGTHLPAGAWFKLHEAIDAALAAAGAA